MARRLGTDLRREQIALAALQVVRVHGVRGLSMERIAEQVGLVPSAIYRHFKDKGGVLDAVLDLIHARLMGILAEARAAHESPLEQLRDLLRRHVKLVQYHQSLPRVMFSDEVFTGNSVRKAKLYGIFADYLSSVADIAREAQREGLVRKDLDPGTISVLFFGLFQPAMMLWFMSDGGFDVGKHIGKAWQAFREGVCPPVSNKRTR